MGSAALPIVERTVPWAFSTSGAYSQWVWATADFTALVVNDSDTWSWEVKDVASRIISSGPGADFDSCADLVLEAIGKGFGPHSGYMRWVGGAAKRYTLASGARVDLSAGDGKAVRVTLTSGRVIDGVLHLGDWLLHVVTDEAQADINPSAVVKVERLA